MLNRNIFKKKEKEKKEGHSKKKMKYENMKNKSQFKILRNNIKLYK